MKKISLSEFNSLFETDIVYLPKNMMALGFIKKEIYLYTDGSHERIPILIEFWQRFINRRLDSKYYLVMCFYDGYRERIKYTEKLIERKSELEEWRGKSEINCEGIIPILHKKKKILAFSKQINDDSCICIPDIYYIQQYSYHSIKNKIDVHYYNWRDKISKCVYRGNLENGSRENFIQDSNMNHRQYFYELSKKKDWNQILDFEKKYMKIEDQLRYKYIVDLDGYTNSWEGLIWKLYSGSVVLKQKSIWKQWYYDELKEWVHYIPLENDLSDFENKIKWCLENDELCQKIASNSRKFVSEKLSLEHVIQTTISNIQELI